MSAGGMAADEVVLLIVSLQKTAASDLGDAKLPEQSLRSFQRIHLKAGESATVQMLLPTDYFSHALPDSLGKAHLKACSCNCCIILVP